MWKIRFWDFLKQKREKYPHVKNWDRFEENRAKFSGPHCDKEELDESLHKSTGLIPEHHFRSMHFFHTFCNRDRRGSGLAKAWYIAAEKFETSWLSRSNIFLQ